MGCRRDEAHLGKVDRYLEELEAVENGPQIAALFDFDGTIIAGYSAMSLLQEKFKRREMGVEEVTTLLELGERATWPKIEMVRVQTRISQTLERILTVYEHSEAEVQKRAMKRKLG